jgi:uncharacterized protein
VTKEGAQFTPAPGLSNNHLMTLAPLLLRRRFPLTDSSGRRILIEVEPGNQVLVMLHQGGGVKADNLILLLHGLESSADAYYVKGVCEKAIHEGFSVARMNMRNCGGTSHLSTTLYNAGMSKDVLGVASQLTERYGFKHVFLCGFSLGGNVVLKAAGEHADKPNPPLAGVCSVSPPIDLEGCVRQMEKGVNRIYEKNFVLSLKLRVYEKARHFPGRYDLVRLRQIRTVRAFDGAFTAPDAGYSSAEEYYYGASARRVLDKIDCPTLIIAAQDDPLVPFCTFETMDRPGKDFRGILLAPANGGHVSFIHNKAISLGEAPKARRDPFWAEWQAIGFFNDHTTGGADN